MSSPIFVPEFYIPNAPLDNFVACFVYQEGYNPSHLIDRFLPDGNVELIIDLSDRPKFIYDNETLKEIQSCHHVWASGVRTEPISIPSGRDAAMLVIAFKRGMAYPFFPFPMHEIVDSVVDADLIWGNDFAYLRERIASAKNSSEKFRLVENFLVKAFLSRSALNPCVEYALNEIIRQPDQINLGRLNQKIGYSQKHFISMFKNQVGVTPKTYLKLMRFQRAINEIEERREIDWAVMSVDCGFYDQSHLINDFKLFSGFTPEEYTRRKSDLYLNYVPVDDPVQ